MPSWFYGPDGQAGIFDECPEGWFDHPCKAEGCPMPVAEAVEVISDALEAAAKFDHDGDGKPGGSKPKARRGKKRG